VRILRDVLSVLAVSLAAFGLIWHWSLIWMSVISAVLLAAMASHPIDLIITDRRKHRRAAAGCAHRDAVPVDLLLTGERVAWLCEACGEQLLAGWQPPAPTATGGITMAQFAEGWDRFAEAMQAAERPDPVIPPEPFYRESAGIDGYMRWCNKCGATWGTSDTRDPFGPTLACPACRMTATGQDDGPTLTYACPAGHELDVPKAADPAWVECRQCAAERQKYDGRIAGPLRPRSLSRRVRQR